MIQKWDSFNLPVIQSANDVEQPQPENSLFLFNLIILDILNLERLPGFCKKNGLLLPYTGDLIFHTLLFTHFIEV